MKKGLISLRLGIASLVLCWFPAGAVVAGILAIVFSNRYYKEHKDERPEDEKETYAKAGRVCGGLGILLGLIIFAALAARAGLAIHEMNRYKDLLQ